MKPREVISILQDHGFRFSGQTGSHRKLERDGRNPVIVPMHKEDVPNGTLRDIWKQAGLREKLGPIKSMTEYRKLICP